MKKWYNIGLVVGLTTILASCYSFNSIQLPEKSKDKTMAKEIVKEVLKEAVKDKPVLKAEPQPVRVDKSSEDIILCPVYVMPAFSKTPDLPFEEILAADKNDPRALDKIRQDHIDDLRQYIARLKQEIRASHNDYLKTCYYRNGKQP